MKNKGIASGIHYPTPLPFLKAYGYLRYKPEDFPIAYDYQVLSHKWKLKLNEYDIKMDMIITEKRIIQKRGTINYKE